MLVLHTAVLVAIIGAAVLGFTEVEQECSRLFGIDDELRGAGQAQRVIEAGLVEVRCHGPETTWHIPLTANAAIVVFALFGLLLTLVLAIGYFQNHDELS